MLVRFTSIKIFTQETSLCLCSFELADLPRNMQNPSCCCFFLTWVVCNVNNFMLMSGEVESSGPDRDWGRQGNGGLVSGYWCIWVEEHWVNWLAISPCPRYFCIIVCTWKTYLIVLFEYSSYQKRDWWFWGLGGRQWLAGYLGLALVFVGGGAGRGGGGLVSGAGGWAIILWSLDTFLIFHNFLCS